MVGNYAEFKNIRIIYPDFLGTGDLNTYKKPLFNMLVPDPIQAEMMAQSAIKVNMTKPSEKYPVPEAYVQILMGYEFLNRDTNKIEPTKNPPSIILHDIIKGTDTIITAANLDVLASAKLSNINIVVSQSAPKIMKNGVARSNFYLRSMTADKTDFYRAPE